MLPSDYSARASRPLSEMLRPTHYTTMEADALGHLYEDLQDYEKTLDDMASAKLDQNFKEEMKHVEQWFSFLSEPEKTATLYALLQHASQVQARFFMNMLQQMIKRDPLHPYLTSIQDPVTETRSSSVGGIPAPLAYKMRDNQTPSSVNKRLSGSQYSFGLGDMEDCTKLFGPLGSDLLGRSQGPPGTNGLLRDGGSAPLLSAPGLTSSRPRSVIEGPASSNLFTDWLNPPRIEVGHIGDRKKPAERPKSADISTWALPTKDNQHFQSPWAGGGGGGGSGMTNRMSTPNAHRFGMSSLTPQWTHRGIPGVVPEQGIFESRRPVSMYESSGINSNAIKQPPISRSTSPGGPEKRHHHITPPELDRLQLSEDRDDLSDHSEASHMSGHMRGNLLPSNLRPTKDKKPMDAVDMELLKDVPAWFRSMRLHKYNSIFEPMKWQDIVKLTDEQLLAKGVAALGARRKMLKVFETIRTHCDVNNIEY
ncbi:uncharacterized protein BYT42DRAFT_557766 [Radiomyces spectabilis]|uniref:uncharacterized protein n=1 Tax=Radiomyces spectabilis TaxID=64574 RepID=UPI00221EB3BF|nr:uncharacterized protein BYT42DRAFT_557766 [Radiomyces spectabilis]KAI8391703.1 hypothetical protein BYT42DRAFT_557766 [Radiomyces spectabilis]